MVVRVSRAAVIRLNHWNFMYLALLVHPIKHIIKGQFFLTEQLRTNLEQVLITS